MSRYAITILLLIFFTLTAAAQCRIISGPMLGYNTEQEVGVWVQLDCEAEVTLMWHDPISKKKGSMSTFSDPNKSNIAHLVATDLIPGTRYEYSLKVDDALIIDLSKSREFTTQPIWAFRGDPPAFDFVAGSCVYVSDSFYDRPGEPYGGEYEIFNQIQRQQPDFMLWLGDNTYFREADWTSRSGIYNRHTHTRSNPQLQKLLSGCHHYAIWDDHDYGPNDSNHTFNLKDIALEAFDDFWMNNGSGAGHTEGNTGYFRWNDCEFYLLDNRWYRDPAHGESMLGDKQLKWLIDALSTSKASFKFVAVGSQVLHSEAIYENYANYPAERQKLLDAIDELQIRNVVFLTGDRHHSEVSKLTTPSGVDVYDITSSSLTSRAYDHSSEVNKNRVANSIIGVRNFAKLSVTGVWRNRKVDVQFYDSSGSPLYQIEIKEQGKIK